MTTKEALQFLSEHQPMPPDQELTERDIALYNAAREVLFHDSEESSLPLILNSFGDGAGFGVYQLVEDVIARHPPTVVVPHLIRALGSPHRSVRYWNAQIASRFPSTDLIEPLVRLLEERDHDLSYAAVTALEQIKDDRVVLKLQEALQRQSDPDIRVLIEEVIAGQS